MRPFILASLLCAAGCGDDRREASADAGRLSADAGPSSADAGSASLDASQPADDALPTTCEGACRELTLRATLGGEQGDFSHARYGVTAPAASASGDWELHVEVHAGGEDACPRESSPTPRQTVVLRLPLLASTAPLVGPSSLSALTFLDFEGRFLPGPSPLSRATRFTVSPRAADVCTACLGAPEPSHAAGFVAFDVAAELAEGTLTGKVLATHCDSLDER